MKTGVYIRVSTDEQAKDGFSINAQREKLTKYVEANDWEIYDFYVDDGISGKNLSDRVEVTRMIDDIKKGFIKNVLVYKLDRLTRSLKDLINLIEIFENNGCCFNSVTEKIDTSNAVGRMFVKIIGIFAEFERENLAERVSFGYEQKTREGNYTNTNGVYGYDYIINEHKLIVNENERKLVNRIFDLYISLKSYLKIAQILNMENVPTKRGGRWSASTIKSILNNPLYIGKIRYSLKNKSKYFITNAKDIETIISTNKWEKVNDLIKRRTINYIKNFSNDDSYYFNIIKCAKCGGNILVSRQKHSNKNYIFYRCSNARKGLCNCSGFSHKMMEKSFFNYLESLKNLYVDVNVIKEIVDNDLYSFDYIKNIISNISLNWKFLTNSERKLFLEKFFKFINVYKASNGVVIEKVEYIN